MLSDQNTFPKFSFKSSLLNLRAKYEYDHRKKSKSKIESKLESMAHSGHGGGINEKST